MLTKKVKEDTISATRMAGLATSTTHHQRCSDILPSKVTTITFMVTKVSSTLSSRSTRPSFASISWSMVLAASRNSANSLMEPTSSDRPMILFQRTLVRPPLVLSTQTTRPFPANTGKSPVVNTVSSVTAAHSTMVQMKRDVSLTLFQICPKESLCLPCLKK